MSDSYRDLRVWQRAMDFVMSVYGSTQDFPKAELFGLVSQMRRAAVSLPSNIAEGKGRITDRDRSHFYSQARGSLLELETQIMIAQRLEYLTERRAVRLLEQSSELGRMLNALILAIRPAEKNNYSAPQVMSIRPIPRSAS